MTLQDQINRVPQGPSRAKLNSIAYALEMLAICAAENRTDGEEWKQALITYAETFQFPDSVKG